MLNKKFIVRVNLLGVNPLFLFDSFPPQNINNRGGKWENY
jgi:hypothetical protein